MADIGFDTAGTDLVVVCEIEIEDEFFGYRAEGGGFAEAFTVAGVGGVDGANFKAGGIELKYLFS